MAWQETPENEATKQALFGWSALVLVPGLLFVFGLIWLVMPPYQPPPQSWANGTYTNPCCAPLLLKDGVLSSGGTTALRGFG